MRLCLPLWKRFRHPCLGVVFTSDGRRSEEIYCIHGLAKLTQFCVSLSFCGHKTGAFTHRKAVSFQIGICSDLYLRSWILGNDWKNNDTGASAKDGIFAKSPRCNTGACRGEMALGERNKFGASMCEPIGSFGVNILNWRKTCDIVGNFRRPTVIRRPRHFSPLPLSLRPWCDTSRQVRSCEIRRAQNIEPPIRIERTQLL